MPYKNTKYRSTHLGATFVLGCASIMLGEPVAAETKLALEEVVVTAQKREESLTEVPISINVVDGGNLDRLGISGFEELDELVPNLVIADSPGNNQIYIRGIGSESGSLSLEQSVSLFRDGIYAGRARQFQQPFLDAARVEVLRGPQGALVGKNTSAGAISITSRLPTDEVEFSIDAQHELVFGGSTVSTVVSGPISENFLGRLVIKYDDVEGYVDNATKNRDEPQGDRMLLRATGVLDISDTVTAITRLEYSASDIEGHPFSTIAIGGNPNDTKTADAEEYDEQDTVNVSITLDAELGSFTLTSITGYVDLESENFVDADFTGNKLLGASFFDDLKQFSQEFRIISPESERFNYIAGIYYLEREVDIFRQTFFNLGPFIGTTNRDYQENSELWSVYGEFNYALRDDLKLVVGGRYTDEDKSGDLERFIQGSVPPDLLDTSINSKLSEDQFDPSVKLQWLLSDQTMVYVSYAKGSKGSAFSGASATAVEDSWRLDPEMSTSYELGVKFDLEEGRGFLAVSAFTTSYKDLQTSTFNGVAFDITNAAEAKSRGVELEVAWKLSEKWRLSGSAAFLDAQYESYPGGPCVAPDHVIPGCIADLSGQDLPNAPQWSGRFDLRYWNNLGGLLFTSDLGVSFRDSYFTHPTLFREARQDAYAKVDLRLELANEEQGWSAAVLVKNMTDAKTVSQAFETPGSAPPGSTPDHFTVTQLVDIGRTVTLQAKYNFF